MKSTTCSERTPVLSLNPNFETDWFVFQRIQELKSAGRINWVRIFAVATFFAIVLVNHFAAPTTSESTNYLWRTTRLCGVWMFLAASVWAALRVRVFPPIFAYLTTSCDILLLTAVASMGERANSQLVLGFFVIVASSYLRYRFRLIVFAAVVSAFGYLTLVYNTSEFWIRPDGVPFPYSNMLRVLAGLFVMTLIGWQLCEGCRQGLRLSIETNLAEKGA